MDDLPHGLLQSLAQTRKAMQQSHLGVAIQTSIPPIRKTR
jgi:hypothetical protein